MTTSDILLRDLSDDGILRLTLNDAKRRNALSEAMLDALATPGGITERGLRVLHERQGLAAWTEALDAALDRIHGEP